MSMIGLSFEAYLVHYSPLSLAPKISFQTKGLDHGYRHCSPLSLFRTTLGIQVGTPAATGRLCVV